MTKRIMGTNKNIPNLCEIKMEPSPILSKLLLENVKIETNMIVAQMR